MLDPFIAKLRHGADLSEGDQAVLRRGIGRVESVEADQVLIHDGDRPGAVRLVLEGMACRHKMTAKGRSSVMAILVPGDFCDLHVATLGAMDHSIRTLTRCKVVNIPTATIDAWTRHPNVNRALWWATLVDEAIMRQWIVNLGARPADERIAHLFVELLHRLRTVGLAAENGYALPFSQETLGHCAGLSTVHCNRVLMSLRMAGMVTFHRHRVTIDDLDRLTGLAGFDPAYLHLKKRRPLSDRA